MSTSPQPEQAPRPDLHVMQMRVVWRDTFIVEHPRGNFLDTCQEVARRLPCYVSDSRVEPASQQPDMLAVIDRVSRSVAAVGHPDLLRVQFAPLQMTNLRPSLARWRCPPEQLSDTQIKTAAVDADAASAWIEVTPLLLLNRSGVGIMQYYATINAPFSDKEGMPLPGYTPEEAIELVRLGIHTQLLSLPDTWRALIPEDAARWRFYRVVGLGPDDNLAVGGLRDLSQVIVARLETPEPAAAPRRRLRRRHEEVVELLPPARPTGSTTVVLLATHPQPGADLAGFVKEHALELRGIGAMDSYYLERAAWIVERELGDNLSTDAESAVYLLGNSELILFNDDVFDILHSTRKRLHLKSVEHAATYIYMHYGVLLEWIYLQDAILRAYLRRLDLLAAYTPLPRREMIDTLQGALFDLIQYQENITTYATRIEFLERARRYHKLDELAERFERKQDLLLTYSSEYQDYREVRAAEFLNWLAAILAGGELGNLIVNAAGITPDENLALYLGATLGSIGVAFAVMIALRILTRREE